MLTDQNKNVTGTYGYDAFGKTNSHTGAATTPLPYAGQYLHAESGLYWMRARYYDPTTAQFVNVDPLATLTKALYAYAGGDPTNATDPSGLKWNWWGGKLGSFDDFKYGLHVIGQSVYDNSEPLSDATAIGSTAAYLVCGIFAQPELCVVGASLNYISTALSAVSAYKACTNSQNGYVDCSAALANVGLNVVSGRVANRYNVGNTGEHFSEEAILRSRGYTNAIAGTGTFIGGRGLNYLGNGGVAC